MQVNKHVAVSLTRDGLMVTFDDLPGQAARLPWYDVLTEARGRLVAEPLVSLTPAGRAALHEAGGVA